MDAAEAFCVWLLVLRRWLRNKKCEIKKRQYEARGRDDPTRRRAPREESRKVAITRKWESAQNKSARRSQRKLLGSIEERWMVICRGERCISSVCSWMASVLGVSVQGCTWCMGQCAYMAVWSCVARRGRHGPVGRAGRQAVDFTISR